MDVILQHCGAQNQHLGATLVVTANQKRLLERAAALIGVLGVQHLVVRIDACLYLSVQDQLHHLYTRNT